VNPLSDWPLAERRNITGVLQTSKQQGWQ